MDRSGDQEGPKMKRCTEARDYNYITHRYPPRHVQSLALTKLEWAVQLVSILLAISWKGRQIVGNETRPLRKRVNGGNLTHKK